MKKLIGLLIGAISVLTGCSGEYAFSTAVIGGQDGPTSVFVAGKVDYMEILGPVLIALVVVAVIVYLKRK